MLNIRLLYILFFSLFFVSCVPYYKVMSSETQFLLDKNMSVIDSIPSGVYYENTLSQGKYRKSRYKKKTGYVLNPYFDNPYYQISNNPDSTTYVDSRQKTVHVKAYTRKDGTQVKAHTRRPPRRK